MGTAKLEDQPIRCVIFGPAGSGKTHLMREFPKPLVLYDFDGKYEPLIGVKGITVKSFYVERPNECKQAWLDFWSEYKKDKKDKTIKTQVFDSLTSLDYIIWNACISMIGKDPEVKKTYQAFTLPLYGDLKGAYETLFSSFKGSDKNVLVLAHETTMTDDEGKLLSISPLLSGSMKDRISAIFKDTWYLEVKGSGTSMKRILHYQRYKFRTCSSVMMNGSGSIENPTYEKIRKEYRT
ncbi:ATP-binding protein [bacterium]|nr:ATP-binding protein [bacterium]